jgi:hypothetical protein
VGESLEAMRIGADELVEIGAGGDGPPTIEVEAPS